MVTILHSDVDSTNFPDQDFLNQFFKGKWVPLPYVYNAVKLLRTFHPSVWDDKAVRNVHYVMSDKPWNKEIVDFEKEFKDVQETGDQMKISLFILNSWWWKMYKGIEFNIEDY
jgi:lipopolysaccharide biosynthesis glycosyltransferase